MDSNLVDIAAGIVSMIATLLFLRFWQPRKIWRFADEQAVPAAEARDSVKHFSAGPIPRAWMALAILSIFVPLWGAPPLKIARRKATTTALKHGARAAPYSP